MQAKPLLSLSLASLLAGCALQSYAPQPIAPAQQAQAFHARNLSDAGLGAVDAWGLPQLTEAALRLNPALDLARAQWRMAQAAEISAGQKPNPTISGGGEHHSRTGGGLSPWTMTLGIEIPIETHGKREARIEQAAALSEAARLEIAAASWQVRSRLRARLLELYAIREQSAQLGREAELRAALVALLEARFAAGMVGGTDLADARLQLQKSRSAADAEAARAAEALAALADSIGVPDTALARTSLSYAAFEANAVELPADAVQRAALLNRLDIRLALARFDAAEARLKLEIAKQYPDFSLAPGYSWDQGDNRWSLGLSLVLALLNRNEGPIAEARAEREVRAREFDALQASVIGEQAQALAALHALQETVVRSRQLAAAQQDRLARSQRQFDAGYADRLELTTARLERASTEAALLQARLQVQHALGRLEDAVQQPLDGSAPLPPPPEETP